MRLSLIHQKVKEIKKKKVKKPSPGGGGVDDGIRPGDGLRH